MRLNDLEWNEFEVYLRKVRGQSISSVRNHKSRFTTLKKYFIEKEFTSKTFSLFLSEVEKSGMSASYQDNCLTLAKHLARYLGKRDEFEDFKYTSEGYSEPEYICSRMDIEKITSVNVKYLRFKARKIKYPALTWFIWQVGSRIDETLHLEWRDIIPHPSPMIHFRKEITKTNRERYCPIPRDLMHQLMKLPKENARIFSLIEATNYREDLALRCSKAKIPYKVKPHTLRDSSINNKLEYGMPFEQVSLYHGHSKIDTTYRFYTRIKARQLAMALYKYDPAFQHDITYDMFVEHEKEEAEKKANPNIVKVMTKKEVTEDNKKITWIAYVEA